MKKQQDHKCIYLNKLSQGEHIHFTTLSSRNKKLPASERLFKDVYQALCPPTDRVLEYRSGSVGWSPEPIIKKEFFRHL